jgi:hypothetical protein
VIAELNNPLHRSVEAMWNLQKFDLKRSECQVDRVSATVLADPPALQPLSVIKRIEIWGGRLAMLGVTTTVAVLVIHTAR